ncbi:MAG: potassium-transporting ATPase subunit KdpA [Thermoguttaceae bacterium]|jgi:K+-transporting ATPase ATPase A chain
MFQFQTWFLPFLILAVTTALAIPFSRYLAWVMDGHYRAPGFLRWIEARVDTGPQSWKQYAVSMMLFNLLMFVFGFTVLALQPKIDWGLNPDGKGMLAPTTIFNAVCSFLTNTNLQHYSGEQHLSYFSQIFFVLWNMFLSASVGFCGLAAIIRALRSDAHVGNYYLDMWRVCAYTFVPASVVMAVLLLADGVPMTLDGSAQAVTVEDMAMGSDDAGQAKPQQICRGPVAAVIPIKHLGTNGGGFFGANSAHPYENPSAWSNFLTVMNFCLYPFALVLMFGRMLRQMRHAWVIFSVMMTMFVGLIVWAVYWDTLHPNPALEAHPATAGQPAVVGLPVDQSLGNLEGKELRFGTSAGATFATATTSISCGSVDCAHDSLNPLAGLSPLTGMWLNCIYGGKGVGMINLLLYLIIGVFIAGLMVGRTPEYLGKKVEAREMKLAMIALLVHPILILMPTGLFAATDWGIKATNNPGPHGFSEVLYEFSSSSANNGSGFEGLGDTWGLNDNPNPAPESRPWDIATGLVMLFSRFIPVIAPMAMAASLGRKKPTPFTVGTMRNDTLTFGFLLLGTIILIGALLFLPVAALGPVAEHLGPIPFGG